MPTKLFNDPRGLVLAAVLAVTTLPVLAQTNQPALSPIAPGPFQPTWESLAARYQCPDWFRDA
jgi:alpha-L-fucosidase